MEGGRTLKKRRLELYSDLTNAAVIRAPGRKFPGVLLQGDSLASLISVLSRAHSAAVEGDVGETADEIEYALDELQWRLDHYDQVLTEHEIPLPHMMKPRSD